MRSGQDRPPPGVGVRYKHRTSQMIHGTGAEHHPAEDQIDQLGALPTGQRYRLARLVPGRRARGDGEGAGQGLLRSFRAPTGPLDGQPALAGGYGRRWSTYRHDRSGGVLPIQRGETVFKGSVGDPARIAKMTKHDADTGCGHSVHATMRRDP